MKRTDIPTSRAGRNLERGEFQKHVREIEKHVVSQAGSCALVVETVVSGWCASAYPALNIGSLRKSIRIASKPQIKEFLLWLSQKPLLEAAYWISSAYSIWVGNEHRKNYAMYFTPPILTNRMLDDLELTGISFATNSFFDPACGGAAFLVPVALRMKTALLACGKTSLEILTHVEKNLVGTDLDPVLCKLSRVFLRVVLAKELIVTGYVLKLRISVGNALKKNKRGRESYDVVVCNPPYRKLSTPELKIYHDDFCDVMQYQPNLYCLFIALCLRLTKKNGIVSLVTPMSFLSGKSFSKLREVLLRDSQILQISVLNKRIGVFLDVEQETALTLLRRSNETVGNDTPVKIFEICEDGNCEEIGDSIFPRGGLCWPIPRDALDVELIALANRSSYRLKDYGYTARIGAFVWNRDVRSTYFTIEEARISFASNPVPLLWASDVDGGETVRFLVNVKRFQEPAFVEIEDINHPSIIKRPAILLQRVTSNDQPQRLVAASVPLNLVKEFGGFIGENHVVILESDENQPIIPPEMMVKLLSSPMIDRYFRCISGATNVSVYELLQLPLPSPIKLTELIVNGFDFEVAVKMAFALP